jgi:glycerol-3-phosphate cytidylyltransferase-like family protein
VPEAIAGLVFKSERRGGIVFGIDYIIAAVMAASLDVRIAKLREAYDQIVKSLDDVHGDVQQLRGEVHTELQQLRAELQTGMRSQFWQFAALVLPLWMAAAALLFRH